MKTEESRVVYVALEKYSSKINYTINEVAIILAAGHGKRIKSQTSKMLHRIWQVPTVERVFNASRRGIKDINLIIVVGIKAQTVMDVLGKRDSTVYAYQEKQNGTGHAVQVALQKVDPELFDGAVYVLPGDMGLIDKETVEMFRNEFLKSDSDMMVLTGIYNGPPEENQYGRIIRVPEEDEEGNISGTDKGRVIEIMEYKDILNLPDDHPYRLKFGEKFYIYSKEQLIRNNEFNSGVYAFKYKKLIELIGRLSSDNAQNEIYITDLIALFNNKGYSVTAISPHKQYVVMGFNDKSVLKEMENVARRQNYDLLKNILDISDPDDFFIHESVIDEILELDKLNIPLDIKIGKGVYIGKGVKLNYNVEFKNNVHVEGDIRFGQNIVIWKDVYLSCLEGQLFKIGNDVEIFWGNTIKGNVEIGNRTRIESGVNMTGSDDAPLKIGSDVLIKGTSYIFGSIIEDSVHIEHSVIIRKKVERLVKKSGVIQSVKFYLPPAEGIDALEDL